MLNKAHLSNEELEQRRVAQAQKREAREAARKKRLEESTDDALDRGVDRHRGRGRLEGSLSLMCDTMDRSMDRVFQPLKKHVDYMTARCTVCSHHHQSSGLLPLARRLLHALSVH